ncbi:DUF2779 domain-containing protein [Empedobacter falsenii]
MKTKKLTKSRFKLGLECPNKLYYTSKKNFVNNKQDDPFLQALASGGFQVEALARLSYQNGVFIDVPNYDYDLAFQLSDKEFKKDNSTIYEATFTNNNLFVRTDIVKKEGNKVKLIEVKAKSFDPNDTELFVGKRGGIKANWKPYLFDLAFQKYVAQLTYPSLEFEAFLYMADKTKVATINGLNQYFRVPKNGDPRKELVIPENMINEIVASNVLSEVNVDAIINDILNNKYKVYSDFTFEETVHHFLNWYQDDIFPAQEIEYNTCKTCEFKASPKQLIEGLDCGFSNCFKTIKKWSNEQIKKPKTFEVWNYRGVGKLVKEDRWFMEEMNVDDFNVGNNPDKLSAGDRQWLQVSKMIENDNSIYVDNEILSDVMKKWKFPLHFIDFETSAVALPFTAGRKPYEQVAFQFSHHMMNEEGIVEHKTQFLNSKPGVFPNFNFVRALYQALKNDEGTIFRFAAHENSILNTILEQLEQSDEKDKIELIGFIKTITNSKKDSSKFWKGERSMVDLRQLILDCYYNPLTKGSNSIKYVLPAILNSSKYLQNKYGSQLDKINVSSLNFSSDHIWLKKVDNEIQSPYKMLPSLFEEWNETDKENTISELEDIDNGGAALTAYAKLQYVDMSDDERKEIEIALLKYCELDTLAMVMVYEHFKNDLN